MWNDQYFTICLVRCLSVICLNRLTAGPYVALTLQGPPPSTAALPLEPLPTDLTPHQRTSLGGEASPPPPPPLPTGLTSTPSQRITGPKPLQVNHITWGEMFPVGHKFCSIYTDRTFKKSKWFMICSYVFLGPRSTETCHSDTQENAGAGGGRTAGTGHDHPDSPLTLCTQSLLLITSLCQLHRTCWRSCRRTRHHYWRSGSKVPRGELTKSGSRSSKIW